MTARMLHCVGALLFVLSTQPHAGEGGVITLAEGGVRVVRGAALLQAAEGVRVLPGDVLEAEAISVVELADGLLLGLGPATRLYLPESTSRPKSADAADALILLSGWLKLQSRQRATADGYLILTNSLGVATRDATLLVHAAEQRTSLFVETGSARLLEPEASGRTTAGAALGAGQFAVRGAGQRVALQGRPDGGFLAAMPRGFRDALPSRPDRLKASPKAAKAERDARYDEVRDLLQLPQSWRGDMVRRFSARLRDAEFRKAIAANMAQHPEWRPILYPPRPVGPSRASLRERDSQPKEQGQ